MAKSAAVIIKAIASGGSSFKIHFQVLNVSLPHSFWVRGTENSLKMSQLKRQTSV
jgi:hypothetical protein